MSSLRTQSHTEHSVSVQSKASASQRGPTCEQALDSSGLRASNDLPLFICDEYCPHSPQHCSNLSSKLTPARLLQRLHYLLSLRENRGHQPSIPSIPHFEPYLILAPCLISHLRENLVRPQSTITHCLPPLPFPSEICFIDNQLPLSYYNLYAISFFLLH